MHMLTNGKTHQPRFSMATTNTPTTVFPKVRMLSQTRNNYEGANFIVKLRLLCVLSYEYNTERLNLVNLTRGYIPIEGIDV